MDDIAALSALIVSAVIGGTELVSRIADRDFKAAWKIGVAAVLGGVGAAILLTPLLGLAIAIFTGISLGLGAAGVVTTATRIGK